MTRFKYLIVGGGMTADAAAREIRTLDHGGSIGLLTDEADPPYERPPLSKGLWKGKPLAGIWRGTEARGVTVIRGRKAVALDAVKQEVVDDQGVTYGYSQVLLATGGTPRRHPADAAATIYFRTLADYRTLRRLSEEQTQFIVVGGGFIGSEMAAALTMNGREVVMTLLESGIGGRIFPPDLSALVTRDYEARGVRVLTGRAVAEIHPRGDRTRVTLEDGSIWTADAVVAGLGILPNTKLAAEAGLDVNKGIVVDEHLRTRIPNIYAAGDVANFPCPVLNRRLRLEHEDHANASGALAGRNMAGAHDVYTHLPYFYSDLFDNGYEAIGMTEPSHPTHIEWVEPERKGAIFYLENARVRGVLLWNLFGKLDAARALIQSPGPHDPAFLKAWTAERLAPPEGQA